MSRLSLGLLIVFLSIAADAVPARAADPPQKNSAPAQKAPSAKPAAPAGGMTVFIDPATGQIRQPDPSEIGTLVTPPNPAPKAPEPLPMQGPGGAVGAKLGPESMSYTVLTITPDGKDTIDCVTGEKAAAALVTAPQASKTKEAPNRPQDTRNVKNPR